MTLQNLSEEERVMLAQYRLCSETDKRQILDEIHKQAAEIQPAARENTSSAPPSV